MKQPPFSFIGVDYGSKLAGTTAICFWKKKGIHFIQSQKKKDADQFLIQQINQLQPSHVFFDAPLSIPGVYSISTSQYDDYFYRQADRDLNAMSPMFLGGLTARAIRLKHQLESQHIKVVEIYPSALAKVLGLPALGYKKQQQNLAATWAKLQEELPFTCSESPKNWHQFDSVLAFYSGYRYLVDKCESYGNKEEGIIYV